MRRRIGRPFSPGVVPPRGQAARKPQYSCGGLIPPFRHSYAVTPKSSPVELRAAADRYLAECFTYETPPHINELAAEVGLSATALTRAFRAQEGIVLSEYLRAARVARARHLLTTTDLPTAVIAYAAAFGTRVTFFRAFRRATGLTPDEYRSVHSQKM